ncbi:VWA domain-containing protein [Pseudaestuariivita atlantica]|uniref:VWFA domain-containing protein n=1 Tax=Pseudaestuariivita atlantica TaxID=1317121 RepID=A0A0L1JS28_9RHOB|nr:VWA domain-containing protein [Pseudaestuariivita atlantica]KNG94599.1 hypothetical protein ATO11_04130 [Pseudaestuariivita atlantica]
MSAFHFLRPEWLLALLPAAIVTAIAWRNRGQSGARDWAGKVDAHLLRHLMVRGSGGQGSRWLVGALAAGLLASVLAMAGPAWEKLPTPTQRGAEPVVVVLSLSQSMNGTDLVPSRLARAGHKVRDILDRAQGEDVGLVIYADRPFVAAPLTPDAAVIQEMLPELSTALMPVLGNRLHIAIDSAREMLTSAGAMRGSILVMADDLGVDPEAARAAAVTARRAGYKVSVLGVGTEEGAQLQTADGQVIRVNGSNAPVVRLDVGAMASLAEAGGGAFSTITPDLSDLDRVLPPPAKGALGGELSDLKADRWHDRGYLLLIVPMLLMPLAFRRGVLFAVGLGLIAGLGTGPGAQAGTLDDLWATPDQQGYRAFSEGDYETAVRAFDAPQWAASSRYKAGDYEGAAQLFGADAYNKGNALAKAGRFEDALAAYDAHLATNPDDADARFNRDLVAKLLEEQQAEDKDQEQEQDQNSQGGDPQQEQNEGSGQTGEEQADQPQSGDQQSDGDQSGEQQSGGDQSGEQQSDGDQSGEQQSGGDQSGEQQSGGDQSGEQQSGGDQSGEQQSGGDQSGEQQSGGDQTGEQQSGGDQSGEQQSGGDQSGEQQSGADQPVEGQPGGRASDEQQGGQSATPGDETAEPGASALSGEGERTGEHDAPGEEDASLLSSLIDRMLEGNGEPVEDEAEQGTARGAVPLSQAAEQQLRAVPDDPAGLLRARIRQHYAQMRANGN